MAIFFIERTCRMAMISNEAARGFYPFGLLKEDHTAMYAADIEARLFSGIRSIAVAGN